MSIGSSAKYYQDNKERLQRFVKDIKVFLKKKKSKNMGINDIKISLKKKNKG